MLQNSGVNNLGLDPNVLMNFESRISSITNAVGLVGESSINTSKALTMLSADMSSLFNIDMSSVMTNLQSGLVGQSRALYKYGIDITNATLQTYAYANGISTAVSEMTQSEKMQLRILAILDQSKVSWGDMANTINSAANQWRIFKQQISNVARTLGNLLIPMVQAVLPWINALTMAFQRFLNFIGGIFFGDKWKNIMDGISGGYSDLGDDLGDLDDSGLTDVAGDAGDAGSALDDANDAAKKLKKTIHSYDELHVATDNSSDSTGGNTGTGSTGGSGGTGSGIDLSGAIADALADYQSVWDKALASSANKAQAYADKIISVFQKMYDMIKKGKWDELGAYIASGINKIFDSINDTFNWDKLGPKISTFVNALTSTINSLVDHVKFYKIGKTFGDGLNVITNTLYLWYKGIDWENIGAKLAEGANGLQDAIDWEMLGQAIGAKMMVIPDILYGFVSDFNFDDLGTNIATALNGVFAEIELEEIGATIGKFATGIFEFFANFAKEFEWDEFGENLANGLNGFFNNFNAHDVSEAINNMVDGLADLIGSFIETFEWGDIFKTLGDIWAGLDWDVKLLAVGATIGSILVKRIGSQLVTTIAKDLIATKIGELMAGSAAGTTATAAAGAAGAGIASAFGVSLLVGVAALDFKLNKWDPMDRVCKNATNGVLGLADILQIGWTRITKGTESAKEKMEELSGGVIKSTTDSGIVVSETHSGMGRSFEQLSGKSTETLNTINGNLDQFQNKYNTTANIVNGVNFDEANSNLNGLNSTANNVNFGPLSNKAMQAVNDVNTTWTNGKRSIQDTVNSTFVTSIDLKNNLSNKFSEYGKNTGAGFVSGIKSIQQTVNQTIEQLANNSIIKPFHDKLQIGSPSKLSAQYAKWFGDGFVNNLPSAFSGVDGFFKNLVSKISSAFSGLDQVGISAGKQIASGLQSVHIPVPHLYTSSYAHNKVGNASYSTPNYSVKWYANGGMPNYGEMFVARENGIPEMVGKMGNHASVANNDQIVEGISAGVKRAVIEAMMSVQGNGQQQSSGNVEIPLIVSGEELARAVYDGMESLIRRGVIKPDFA